MDTKYISYILTIAKLKNMTKAAEELYVSQSSLSQYLSKLEQELGTPLFYRTKWELVPTPAGELYIEACHQVMNVKEQLYRQIKELDNSGNIAVGTTSQFGLKMMTEIIPKFKEQYPHFNITISKGNLNLVKRMLQEETVDAALVSDTVIPPAFKGFADILREEEVLIAIPRNHPYVKKNPSGKITVEDFIKEFSKDNFIMSKEGSSLRKVYDSIFEGAAFKPQILCETNSVPTVNYMIASGSGISLMGESCSQGRDKIAYYSFDKPVFRLNLLIRRKSWVLHKPERLFCEMVKNYFKEHTEKPYFA